MAKTEANPSAQHEGSWGRRVSGVTNVLLTVAVVNMLASACSLVLKPTSTNWQDPTKLVCHSIWEVTGCFSVVVLVVSLAWWLRSHLILSQRRDWRLSTTLLVAGFHSTMYWVLIPAWS